MPDFIRGVWVEPSSSAAVGLSVAFPAPEPSWGAGLDWVFLGADARRVVTIGASPAQEAFPHGSLGAVGVTGIGVFFFFACFWGARVGNARGGATGGAPAGVFHTPNSLRGTLVTPGSWCPGACWAVPWRLGEGLATCPPERPPQLCRLHGPSVRQMWAAVPTSGEVASVGHCFPGFGKGDFLGGQVLSPSRLPHKGFPWSQRRKPGLPALPPPAHFTLSEDATGGKDLQTKEPGVPATAVWAGKPGPGSDSGWVPALWRAGHDPRPTGLSPLLPAVSGVVAVWG